VHSVLCSKYSKKDVLVCLQCQGDLQALKSIENLLLLPPGRFALVSVNRIILIGGSGLWKVVLDEVWLRHKPQLH